MEILTSVKRIYIRFKSLVNDTVYSFGRAALLLLVEVQNHTVPVRERRRIRVKRRQKRQNSQLYVPNYTTANLAVAYNNASEFDDFRVGKKEFYKFRFVLTLELKGIHCNGNVFCLLSVRQWILYNTQVHTKLKGTEIPFFYSCTVHSDIHTIHSPTDAHLIKPSIKNN